MCGFAVDNGETIVQRAAIISPKSEGKGYMQLLNQCIIQEARQRYHLQRLAFAVDNDHSFTQRNSFWKQNTLISTKHMFRYMVTPGQLSQSPELPNSRPLKNVSIHAVAEYFHNEVIRKYLFPDGRMVVHWVPHRLLASNLALLDSTNTVCFSDVKVNDGFASGLLSIATFYTVLRPRYAYIVDLYGTDVNSVRYHLLYHLGFIVNTLKDLACLSIVADRQFKEEKLLDVIAEWRLIKWTDSDKPNKTVQLFLESNL